LNLNQGFEKVRRRKLPGFFVCTPTTGYPEKYEVSV
jgi:hypothetical protein